jgi:hypothetical protein
MRCLLVLLVPCALNVAEAQSGGFITMLGQDTVQVESFHRAGSTWSGTVVARMPALRVLRWSMTLDSAGRPLHYLARAIDAAGRPVLRNVSGELVYSRDSVVRKGYARDSAAGVDTMLTIQRVADSAFLSGAGSPFHAPSLPLIGVSNLMYELALRDAWRRAPSRDTTVTQISLNTSLPRPSRLRAWLVGKDSAEIDFFGRARSGYRFGANGDLIRTDWTGTTYKYRTRRVATIDVEPIATAWGNAERAGRGFGAPSPRDSVMGVVGGAAFTIDYSRPARRGRVVWGSLVPMGQVWRLGADFATHFTTSADLDIGGTVVPAGRYTLWMIPSDTAATLIVSSAVNVFGTNYDARRDFARIQLQRAPATPRVERLTLGIANGVFFVDWDDVRWFTPVKTR